MYYFTFVGSYDGAVKIRGHWVRVVELNRINKTGWSRHQGPISPAMARAVREQPPTKAVDLFPHLANRK